MAQFLETPYKTCISNVPTTCCQPESNKQDMVICRSSHEAPACKQNSCLLTVVWIPNILVIYPNDGCDSHRHMLVMKNWIETFYMDRLTAVLFFAFITRCTLITYTIHSVCMFLKNWISSDFSSRQFIYSDYSTSETFFVTSSGSLYAFWQVICIPNILVVTLMITVTATET
jgi:hypothetical protein